MSFLNGFSFGQTVSEADVAKVVDKEGLVFLFVTMAEVQKLRQSLSDAQVDHPYFQRVDELLQVSNPGEIAAP